MPVTFVPVVDLSEHQGDTDFVKMRAAGVQGLILRVSHGQTIDARYGVYYQRALDTGFVDTDICHYTFINPKRGTGAQCAARTLAEIDKVVGHTNVGYMLDVENYRDESPNRGQAPVYGPAFADHIREHLATVHSQAPGAVPFGYGNLAYWNGKVAGTTQQWVGDDALAGELEWLAARYPAYSDAQYARLGYPGPPESWHDWAFRAQQQGPLPPRGGKWWGWQFSAGWNRQGPVYGATSGDLDLNIVHPDAWARWTNTVPFPPPNPHPISEDDMEIRLVTPTDSDARFFAEVTGVGAARRCEWTGDGGDPKVVARIKHFRDAFVPTVAAPTFELSTVVAELVYVSLDGPLPPGFTAGQFANTAEIENGQGTVDEVARADARLANDAALRNAGAISDIRMGGQRIADAGGH